MDMENSHSITIGWHGSYYAIDWFISNIDVTQLGVVLQWQFRIWIDLESELPCFLCSFFLSVG